VTRTHRLASSGACTICRQTRWASRASVRTKANFAKQGFQTGIAQRSVGSIVSRVGTQREGAPTYLVGRVIQKSNLVHYAQPRLVDVRACVCACVTLHLPKQTRQVSVQLHADGRRRVGAVQRGALDDVLLPLLPLAAARRSRGHRGLSCAAEQAAENARVVTCRRWWRSWRRAAGRGRHARASARRHTLDVTGQ
jgi:hypothetical protein